MGTGPAIAAVVDFEIYWWPLAALFVLPFALIAAAVRVRFPDSQRRANSGQESSR
jgi:hypothetical protein